MQILTNKKKTLKRVFFMVPMAGVEPARGCPHKILSLARLPIPSHRLTTLYMLILAEK